MKIVLNGEDPNSILTWVGQGGATNDIMVESLSTQTNMVWMEGRVNFARELIHCCDEEW